MKNIEYLILALSLLCLSTCTKELPYPDINTDEVLVLNGLISPESGATVHLSHNCHVSELECQQNNIENAQIFLKDENGNDLVELIHGSQGQYAATNFIVEHDKVYQIEARSSGFETIQSKGKTPKPFVCHLNENDESIMQEYLCRTFEIEIEDNPDEDNYYLIDGWIDILNGSHDEFTEHEINGYILPHTGFITNDINAENAAMLANIDYIIHPLSYIFLKDEKFNGQSYTLNFGLFEEDINLNKNLDLRANITVKSVSKEVYDYFHSVTLYKLNNSVGFSEPQQVFSNIEEGIGIFGGFTQQQFVVDLPQTEYYFPNNTDLVIDIEGCTSTCTVHFSIEGIGEKVVRNWSFGDGNFSTEKNPTHEYESPGTYTVELNMSAGGENHLFTVVTEVF